MTSCCANKLNQNRILAGGDGAEQRRYFEEKRLYTLQIESTDVCPQDCIYCYAGCSTETKGDDLTSDDIFRVLEVAAAFEVRAIDWLGGDPLVRKDWYELMQQARSLGLINNVWTSGFPLAIPGMAEKVVEVTENGFVSVHLDSINPDTFRRLRRRTRGDKIDQVVSSVDRLLALGKSPDRMINCITYTAIQEPEDVIETMQWWYEQKGMRTCLTMFNPAGMGANMRHLIPSPEATRRVYRARDSINFGDGGTSIACMDTDKYYCGTKATVTFTGEVTVCSVIREGVGNIRTSSLKQILDEHLSTLVHAEMHDPCRLPSPCKDCMDNEYCWGCRASAYNYSGDATGLDPKCWKVADFRGRGFAVGS